MRISLDDNVIERLASLICGQDGTPYYRAGHQLEKFFRAAGLAEVPEFYGYRRDWTIERLLEHRDEPDALRKIILRVADPREYIGEDDLRMTVVTELNSLLAIEGYHVSYERGKPLIGEVDSVAGRFATETPTELTASIEDIVSDADFAKQLRKRLDEAYTCWRSGAPTAAIIMLGSILEGVLYDVAVARHVEGEPRPVDNLQRLIEQGREMHWIGRDVAEYADVLRNHRNLVHPKKQWMQSYEPSDDLARIAWNVVVAALNDLSGTSDFRSE